MKTTYRIKPVDKSFRVQWRNWGTLWLWITAKYVLGVDAWPVKFKTQADAQLFIDTGVAPKPFG